MSLFIQLVRHGTHADVGHVLSGRAGGALTAPGRAQVERLAATMERPRLIQSSPQRRARETAALIAHRFDEEFEVVDALDEIDFGEWTGRSFDALQHDPRWSAWNERRASSTIPGGETMAVATVRIVTQIESLIRRVRRGTAVCVSHCDMIRGAIAHYLGLSLDNLLRFDIDPASVSTLHAGGDGVRVVALNRILA